MRGIGGGVAKYSFSGPKFPPRQGQACDRVTVCSLSCRLSVTPLAPTRTKKTIVVLGSQQDLATCHRTLEPRRRDRDDLGGGGGGSV